MGTRRRTTQRRANAKARLSDDQIDHLTSGWCLSGNGPDWRDPGFPWPSEDARRASWEAHRDEIMDSIRPDEWRNRWNNLAFVKPGTRPDGWWDYEEGRVMIFDHAKSFRYLKKRGYLLPGEEEAYREFREWYREQHG